MTSFRTAESPPGRTRKGPKSCSKVCDFETRRKTGILGQLKWESLEKRRKDSRFILLYKGLKGKARIPTDEFAYPED